MTSGDNGDNREARLAGPEGGHGELRSLTRAGARSSPASVAKDAGGASRLALRLTTRAGKVGAWRAFRFGPCQHSVGVNTARCSCTLGHDADVARYLVVCALADLAGDLACGDPVCARLVMRQHQPGPVRSLRCRTSTGCKRPAVPVSLHGENRHLNSPASGRVNGEPHPLSSGILTAIN